MSEEIQSYICPECERHAAQLKPPVTYQDTRCYQCNDAFEHDVQMVRSDDTCISCGLIVVPGSEYCRHCEPDDPGQVSLIHAT